jgi:arylsulfatase A-like enzyme
MLFPSAWPYRTLVALRYNHWKLVFAGQRAHGLDVWQDPFVTLRFPKLFNLRSDPFETADREGMDYNRWRAEHIFLFVPAQQFVGAFLTTFKEFPPSQKAGTFTLDSVLDELQQRRGN